MKGKLPQTTTRNRIEPTWKDYINQEGNHPTTNYDNNKNTGTSLPYCAVQLSSTQLRCSLVPVVFLIRLLLFLFIFSIHPTNQQTIYPFHSIHPPNNLQHTGTAHLQNKTETDRPIHAQPPPNTLKPETWELSKKSFVLKEISVLNIDLNWMDRVNIWEFIL